MNDILLPDLKRKDLSSSSYLFFSSSFSLYHIRDIYIYCVADGEEVELMAGVATHSTPPPPTEPQRALCHFPQLLRSAPSTLLFR